MIRLGFHWAYNLFRKLGGGFVPPPEPTKVYARGVNSDSVRITEDDAIRQLEN